MIHTIVTLKLNKISFYLSFLLFLYFFWKYKSDTSEYISIQTISIKEGYLVLKPKISLQYKLIVTAVTIKGITVGFRF